MAGRAELADLLDRLEAIEDPFLSWGVVGTVFSDNDVDEVVETWLDDTDSIEDSLDLIDDLVEAGLLLRVEGGYRTRVGELLWEVANLRQLFPRRDDPEGPPSKWRNAPTLVDGFRYTRRPREYPRRDLDARELMERVTEPGSVDRDVFRTLTTLPDGVTLRLAGFQERATETVLVRARTGRSDGAIVGAGTGSGKTLAFYLPALTHLARTIDASHHLRALALYPRNELLKDQLQSGVEQAVRVAALLRERHGRPVRVGALFGDVPDTLNSLRRNWHRSWRKRGTRRVCPYLRCPGADGHGCGGDLSVDAQDRGDEPTLCCERCSTTLPSDVFALTREQLRRRPADLLYSSTEMLNRSLLDPSSGHVLGLDVQRGPDLVLLDEVHTYGGPSGAMTALTLRRWRHRIATNPTFVGLSATLLDAPRFFGDLVGLHADQVADIRPDPDELVPEGAEYHLLLRGDPTSGAGLLSTTIQTSMLLTRMMDPPRDERSQGLFGSKLFVFTDDLDVTNRLYFDSLDAEGQRHRSGGGLPYKPSLAHLRSPHHDETAGRRRAGQVWDLAQSTGHGLGVNDRLRVSRTSSQDAGLDPDAQLVIATASLEVGVDDPGVGGVLQHKAPRDNAAFLQRQGRAGRNRGSRPITAVVVSDYGRDRETFEAWDQLLSPLLRPSSLPVRNAHVLRMQAVLGTLGWAASRTREEVGRSNLWSVLSQPPRNDWQRAVQAAVADTLRSVISDEAARSDLSSYLQAGLGLEPSIAEALLWEPPRPLLLGAVPALLRRIHDGWRVTTETGPSAVMEDAGARQPLPEFIPPTLFSPLALPEVQVRLPTPSGADPTAEPTIEPMGLIQALREFCPGRVTKRFAIGHDLDRAWVEVTPGSSSVDVDTFVNLYQHDGEIDGLPLLRPLQLLTQRPADDLTDSSNGRPTWVTEIGAQAPGIALLVPDTEPISGMLLTFEAHLHRDQRQVEVRRGVVGAEVSLLFRDGREERSEVSLDRNSEPVLLGGAFDVDALRMVVEVVAPDGLWDGPHGPSLRSAYLRDAMTARLQPRMNPFLAGWLHDVVSNALLREAIASEATLQAAWDAIRDELPAQLDATLQLLFAVTELDLGEGQTTNSPRKLRDRLTSALNDPDVLEEFRELVPLLWASPDVSARAWLHRRLLRTIGEHVIKGAALLCPEHDPEGVVLDVIDGPDGEELWISEQTVGGGGFLEAVVDACAADPDRLFRLGRASLLPSARELVGSALEVVVRTAAQDGTLNAAFQRYRGADDARDRIEALRGLRTALEAEGITVTPDVVGAVVNRLLRPGSSHSSDETVSDSLSRWLAAERRLGVEVPVRTWAFIDATSAGTVDQDLLARLETVLWPRGALIRDRQYGSYNPFASEPDPTPDILAALLSASAAPPVSVGDSEKTWAELDRQLRAEGAVGLHAEAGRRDSLLAILARTATEAIELDNLRLSPRVTEVSVLAGGHLRAALSLPLLGRWGSGQHDSPGRAPIGSRRIMTSGQGRMADLEQVHHLLFLMELLAPSSPLWIVSAWLSDVAVVDNRGGELSSIAPGLPARRIGLVEVLTELVSKGGDVRVVVREDEHNRAVVGQLQQLERRSSAGSLSVSMRRDLHDKLVVGERLLVEGSMNLTHRGALRNEEGVRVVTETADIATQRHELNRRFGGGAR